MFKTDILWSCCGDGGFPIFLLDRRQEQANLARIRLQAAKGLGEEEPWTDGMLGSWGG